MAARSQLIGQVLGHYRIIEQIGAGGMGVVYRAHDEQLDRDVAVKVLPVGTLADEAVRKRFRHEALALARLNHPNVGAVYEFGSDAGVDFLVMELVSGVTLDLKLNANPLPEKEVLRLGTQLADGLDAAHSQGVIHHDLKPGNLRLTSDGRLKILDFGLAQWPEPEDASAATVTLSKSSSEISGTLPYMAPEQLRGHKADSRTDIYSCGAVLYEMVTGKRPFPGISGPQLVGAILEQPPSPPSATNHRISPALESIVLKALDKDPNRRYQSARELKIDLERLSSGVVPLAARRHPHLWLVTSVAAAAAALTFVAALNVGGWRDWWRGHTPTSTPPSNIKSRRSVAVLGFKNLSGRPDESWLSTALPEILTTELAAGEKLRTIPGETVSQMKMSLSLPDAESYGKETLNRLRTNLNADDVVVGSYLALGNGQVRMDLRLQDAALGETLASVSESGSEAELSELVARAGEKLREKLGAGGISDEQAGTVRAALPSSSEAARFYSEGLAKLRVFDALGAGELLEKAVAIEPSYPLAHSALAGAWSALGYDGKARDESKRAFELSANLSREERLLIEGRYREFAKEREKAVEIYGTLFHFFPDNLEHGLRFAIAQDDAGRSSDALTTVAALRKLPEPTRNDPRIDLAEAAAAGSLADYPRAQGASARAAQKGEAEGARLLTARARLSECWIYHRLGQFKQALASCQSARDIYIESGDRNSMAWAMNNIGNVALDEGDYAGARKMFEESLAVFRQIGSKNYAAGALGDLANVLQYQGDLRASKQMHQESLALYHEIGNTDDATIEMLNVASILLLEGDLRRH